MTAPAQQALQLLAELDASARIGHEDYVRLRDVLQPPELVVAGHARRPARDGWAMTCSCGTSSSQTWAEHVEERIRRDQIRRTSVDVCANCGDLVVRDGDGDELWAHYRGPGSRLWNCQHTVPYGARATPAHGGSYFAGPDAAVTP
jgi:hypothetical protein